MGKPRFVVLQLNLYCSNRLNKKYWLRCILNFILKTQGHGFSGNVYNYKAYLTVVFFQTVRQTDSFIPPIYNTIWWGRLLLRHKHMSLSKEPPYNNDKQWITLYIKYTYRPVMWVRKLRNVTYWTGRSGMWLCYSLKTVQTVDEKWMMYTWWDEAEYIL